MSAQDYLLKEDARLDVDDAIRLEEARSNEFLADLLLERERVILERAREIELAQG